MESVAIENTGTKMEQLCDSQVFLFEEECVSIMWPAKNIEPSLRTI